MTMWRVTVKPSENVNAWTTYVQQGIIAIGWPKRSDDDAPQVLRFQEIQKGDWVVAHVPEERGGGPCLALGVGCVLGPYHEVRRSELPPGDMWNGDFRRQYKVEWTIGPRSLRPILDYYRGTVHRLEPEEEAAILRSYGLPPR